MERGYEADVQRTRLLLVHHLAHLKILVNILRLGKKNYSDESERKCLPNTPKPTSELRIMLECIYNVG